VPFFSGKNFGVSLGSVKTLVLLIPLVGIGAAAAPAQSTTDIAQALRARVATLTTPAGARIGKAHIAAGKFLQDFYAARQYRPAWSNPKNVAALKQAIGQSWTDGLLATDFHSAALGVGVETSAGSKLNSIDLEILRSDALVRLLYQLHFGKVHPERLDPNWNYKRPLRTGEGIQLISDAIDHVQIPSLMIKARPDNFRYELFRAAMLKLVTQAQTGEWPKLPDGPVLKPGASDPRIPILRQRLVATGEYKGQGNDASELYDPGLVAAVQAFQNTHRIDIDGVIGPATVRAMNVSAADRINQIRVNLERARWILPALKGEQDLVVVNIAGFYLVLYLNGEYSWSTDVITGKPYHKTPVFTENMKYLVLNPDWTVPRSIIRNEIIPKSKADPTHLSSRNFDLIAKDGRKVAPQSLNWAAITPRTFPYRVVQRPGPNNALGLVKFIFPNRFHVYLHDTPSRQLFSKTGRAFSHGCIRVKDPMKFAELILGQRNGMSREEIDRMVATGKQKRVNLSKPLKVAILYWTVDPGQDGSIFFYNDIYGRDSKLLKALNAEFRLR
jgi:L,D-transpeptidase YcbB